MWRYYFRVEYFASKKTLTEIQVSVGDNGAI